jgi:hypothetical protein
MTPHKRKHTENKEKQITSGNKDPGWYIYIFFFSDSTALVGQDLLIVEASRSYSDKPHSVELLWTSDRPVAEASTNTQHSQERDIYAPGAIRTHIPNKGAAPDPRLRPHGHWDRWLILI